MYSGPVVRLLPVKYFSKKKKKIRTPNEFPSDSVTLVTTRRIIYIYRRYLFVYLITAIYHNTFQRRRIIIVICDLEFLNGYSRSLVNHSDNGAK